MKKIISLILALTMIFALAMTASAASITITPTFPENALDKPDYYYIKLFDAEITDAGTTYSINKNQTALVNNLLNRPDLKSWLSATLSADGSKYHISLTAAGESKQTELGEAAFAKALARELLANFTPASATKMTYQNHTFTATGLTDGYYYVTSVATNTNTLGGRGVVVKTLGEDITITEKTDYPTLTKTVDGKKAVTVDNGQSVTFTLTIELPEEGNWNAPNLVVEDTTDGVTIDTSSIVVTAPSTGNATPTSVEYKNNKLRIEFIEYFAKSNWGETITITYTGIVNALTKDATNTAKISLYDFNGDPDYTTPEDSVTLSNAQLKIWKYTGEMTNSTGLAGAGFVLKNAEGKYYQASEVDGVFTVNWVNNLTGENCATEYITADVEGTENDYMVFFKGLAAGTYTLIENTVPAGYNKAEDQTVTISETDGIAQDKQVDVQNMTGSVLPSTGGMGTTLFYILGSLMAVGALVVLVTNKRVRV